MKILLFVLIVLPVFVAAQEKGVKFVENLTWAQVLEKAKVENKYVFVDAFATWCVPCKKMDKEVYTTKHVGDIANEKYISVKVQMDVTERDDETVKSWYVDAKMLREKFAVSNYPTYLFFSPEGKLVHAAIGYKKFEEFADLLDDVLDPRKQYFTLLDNYKAGKKDYPTMGRLVLLLMEFKEKGLTNLVALDYKENYLDKLDTVFAFTKENLTFIGYFVNLCRSSDQFFKLFLLQPEKADKIRGRKGFSDILVNRVIMKEELEDRVWRDGKPITFRPKWDYLRRNIDQKYGKRYGENILDVYKASFYKRTEKWVKWCDLIEAKIKKYKLTSESKFLHPWGDAHALNGFAWDAFQFCNNGRALKRALVWSNYSIRLTSTNSLNLVGYLDTRANLLYRIGRVKDAIEQEERAIEKCRTLEKENGRSFSITIKELSMVLTKMRSGQPTW